MQIHDLAPTPGSTKRRKIVGRGPGSGHGKTSGRGTKGQGKHEQINPNFEGGQSPLHRRLPQVRGFKPVNKKDYAIINVSDLEDMDEGATITAELLIELRVIRDIRDGVKILGDGELTKKMTVQATKVSESAKSKIEAVGGTVELL